MQIYFASTCNTMRLNRLQKIYVVLKKCKFKKNFEEDKNIVLTKTFMLENGAKSAAGFA